MLHVFIILLNYNNDSDTHECLKSIKNLNHSMSRISSVVIDNGSENPFKLTANEKKESVYLIRLEGNLGFTGGNNTGIKFAIQNGATHLLILNNDTILDKNIVDMLLSGLERHKDAGVTVPK